MNNDHRSRGRPRKKLPDLTRLILLAEKAHRGEERWKIIEWKLGCSRRTILRRILPSQETISPT